MRLRSVFRSFVCAIALLAIGATAPPSTRRDADVKLDATLLQRAHAPRGSSRIIVRTTDGRPAEGLIHAVRGFPEEHLPFPGGQVASVPDAALRQLAAFSRIAFLALDREVQGTLGHAAATTGARWVQEHLGFDGTGIGVATIDSGIAAWHEDLAGRMVHFADFVNLQPVAYDDYGHGTHVAGIIAGNGQASMGARRGMAPGAHLIVLKALDAAGGGYISNVIAALDYAIANRDLYNIRIINLSVAATVQESYYDDPLTLAARRAVEAGIVVVASAGNRGRTSLGRPQYGGITAPGNAPWVLTVGASSDRGTLDRSDDVVARFSSRGPAAIDLAAKPDLVAPGVGIESTTEPSSVLFAAHPASRLQGTLDSVSEPYLSLSGTSMASPIVAGTAALMLQANPSLTPNAVKAILQFSADWRDQYDHLTQGAGLLNARAAVELARTFAGGSDAPRGPSTDSDRIRGRVIWGNRIVELNELDPAANAWATDVVWGATTTPQGAPVALSLPCDWMQQDCTGRVACDPAVFDCGAPSGSSGEVHDIATLCARSDCDAALLRVPAAHQDWHLRRVKAGSAAATSTGRRRW